MEAHLLSLNNFNMPKVCKATDSAYVHLVYLLLLDKGKIQSHPNMGVGLRSRYRYNNSEGVLHNLNAEIMEQIDNYLPELSAIRVTTGITKSHRLGILVESPEGVYSIGYDNETNKTDIAATYVLEDLIR